MVFVGVVRVNRSRVRVVGGGANVEGECVSVYGAVGWVAGSKRVGIPELIALDVRGRWRGWRGMCCFVSMGDCGMVVRVQSDERWGVVGVILVFRVAVRNERRWVVVVGVIGNDEVVFCDGA